MAKETKYGIPSLKKDFPTDEACLAYVFDTLHSRECSCGGTYRPIKGRKQFQCSKCRFQIAPLAGTIFHKSDTPLSLWFQAILLFSNAKSGISAKQLERELEVTYKCAWRILSQIRKSLPQSSEPLKGDIEVDSSYIGGRGYGGKNNEKLGEAMAKKSIVTAAIKRGKTKILKAEISPNVGAATLERFVRSNVKPTGGWLMTDAANTYKRLKEDYCHDSVDHSKEFVKGSVHVNNVETWFAHLKRSLRGTFKSVSRKHLQSYLDAFVFHYNNAGNDRARFGVLLGAVLRPAI